MPAQLGETVRFVFEFSVAGVPTSGLVPAPLVTIYSPAGVALVSGAALTEQVAAAVYIYDYVLPGVAGWYIARATSSQANLDATYVETGVEVGQAWIEDIDAPVSGAAAGVWNVVLEGGQTAAWFMRILMAAMAGRLNGVLSNTPKFRDMANTKDRISATTTNDGRTGVTLDGS